MLQRSSTNNICFFFFVLQEKKKKKKAMALPSSSSFLCNARSYKEEGDGSYAVVAFFFMLWSCSATPCSGATAASLHAAELLQRGSTLRSSMLAVAVRCSSAAWLYVEELLQRGSTLRSCCSAAPWRSSMLHPLHKEGNGNCRRLLLLLCAAQEKEEEEGDGSYRRLLLLAMEVRCSTPPCYGAAL
jgi:hypothetical protein